MAIPILKRSIFVVNGYTENIFPFAEEYNAGLIYRSAIVLNTFDQIDGIYFDSELYFELLISFLNTLDYDSIIIRIVENNEAFSISDLKNYICSMPAEDQYPPKIILLYKNKQMNCIIKTELWAYAGGPYPYGDSYTIAIYTKEDISQKVIESSKQASTAIGAEIIKIIDGDLLTEPYKPWWKKLMKKLFQ